MLNNVIAFPVRDNVGFIGETRVTEPQTRAEFNLFLQEWIEPDDYVIYLKALFDLEAYHAASLEIQGFVHIFYLEMELD